MEESVNSEKHGIIFLLILILQPVLVMAANENSHQYRGGTYIVVLCLFLILVAATTAYLFRRYGCVNTGTSANPQENEPIRLERGMDAKEVESLPSLRFSEIKMRRLGEEGQVECAVCLNEFNDQEILRILPDCLHVFHPDCIAPWLSSNVTCPVCRTSLEHREESSVSISSILERITGTLSERFDMVDDDHVTMEIEGSSSLRNPELSYDNVRERLKRSYSANDVTNRFVGLGGNAIFENLKSLPRDISPKSDHRVTISKPIPFRSGNLSSKSDSLIDYSSLVNF